MKEDSLESLIQRLNTFEETNNNSSLMFDGIYLKPSYKQAKNSNKLKWIVQKVNERTKRIETK